LTWFLILCWRCYFWILLFFYIFRWVYLLNMLFRKLWILLLASIFSIILFNHFIVHLI
jgi:hypothetical protein